MRLNQVRDFVQIVEAGSIRAAARSLGVSHPAMTQSLRQLEDDLEVQLLRRGTRGVVPTPAGRAFFERARAIQAEVRKAEEEVRELASNAMGNVSISVSPAAAALFAPQAIAHFLQRHPLVRLRVMEGTVSALAQLVRDESLDFALGNRPPKRFSAGLKFRPLIRTPMIVAGRRGHPLRTARSLPDLATVPWLGLYPQGSGGMVEQIFASAGLPFPKQYVMCESYIFAFELMAQTDAVMPLPANLLVSGFTRPYLAEIALDRPVPSMMLGICTRADTRLTQLSAELARTVGEVARRLASANR
jgi:LysR family transcriptional regulator, regulator of abg operon